MLIPSPLPLELWEEIVYSVVLSHDLLSLALASRFFKSIIIPHHLAYRTICCDLRRAYVWAHLVDHRRRTRGVHRLELVDERDCSVQLPPSLIQPKTFYEKEHAAALSLAQALLHMTRLEQFEWKYVPTSISNFTCISRLLVNKSSNLRALSIKFDWPMNTENSNYTDDLNTLPVWQLDNLTRIFLTYPCQSAQEMVIQRCPNLIDLYLSAPTHRSDFSSVLEEGHWTKLRRLSLAGKLIFLPRTESTVEEQELASNFFTRQTSLECLLLDIPSLPTSLLNFSLRMLRSISWTVSVSATISSFVSAFDLSRIVHYQTTTRDIDPSARMDSLKTLQINMDQALPPNLRYFFQNACNLTRLSLGGRVYPRTVKQLIASLVAYSKLTHVYLASTFRPSEVRKLPRKLSKIKTLQYIQVTVDQHDLLLEIDRTAGGGYSGYHFIPSSELSPDQHPSRWGNFFLTL